jgi:hypothetical protein
MGNSTAHSLSERLHKELKTFPFTSFLPCLKFNEQGKRNFAFGPNFQAEEVNRKKGVFVIGISQSEDGKMDRHPGWPANGIEMDITFYEEKLAAVCAIIAPIDLPSSI